MNSFQHPYCPVLFTMFAFTPGAVLRQFPAPSSKCTTLCTPALGPKPTTSLRIVGETDLLPKTLEVFNAKNTKRNRAERTKKAASKIAADRETRLQSGGATSKTVAAKRRKKTKPTAKQVQQRERALLAVMQGDQGIAVADDHRILDKRLIAAAKTTNVGSPVLEAWKEMKYAIDTTQSLYRQRILTAQYLHRACSFTPYGSEGFFSG